MEACTCDCGYKLPWHMCECPCEMCQPKANDEQKEQLIEALAIINALEYKTNCHTCIFGWFLDDVNAEGACRRHPPKTFLRPKAVQQGAVQRVGPQPNQQMSLGYDYVQPIVVRAQWCGEYYPNDKFNNPDCCDGDCENGCCGDHGEDQGHGE